MEEEGSGESTTKDQVCAGCVRIKAGMGKPAQFQLFWTFVLSILENGVGSQTIEQM